MGCDLDWPSLQAAVDFSHEFVVPFEVLGHVCSPMASDIKQATLPGPALQ